MLLQASSKGRGAAKGCRPLGQEGGDAHATRGGERCPLPTARQCSPQSRGWTLILACKLFQCQWIKCKSPKFMSVCDLLHISCCARAQRPPWWLCASSCNQIPAVLFIQVKVKFCFTDQIFNIITFLHGNQAQQHEKKALVCRSEENIAQQLETNKSQHARFNGRLKGMFAANTFLMYSSLLLFISCLFLYTSMFSSWIMNLPVGRCSWHNAAFLSLLVWPWHKVSSSTLQKISWELNGRSQHPLTYSSMAPMITGVFFKFHEHSSDVCGLCKEWEKYLKQFSKQLNSPFCLSLFTLDHVTKLHLCPINSIRFHSVQINRIILMRIKRTMCWGCPRTWIQTQTHLNKSVISTVYLHAYVFAVVIFLLSSILHIPKVLIT